MNDRQKIDCASDLNDNDEAALYWRAYLDGARAQKKEVQ